MSRTELELDSAAGPSTSDALRELAARPSSTRSKASSRVSLPVLVSGDAPAVEYPPAAAEAPARVLLWASERLRLVCICWTLAQAGALPRYW